MKTCAQTMLLVGFWAFCGASSGQISSTEPGQWTSATDFELDLALSPLKLSHNRPELIRQELLDTNTVRLLAKFAGLTEAELSTVLVARWGDRGWVTLFQLGKSEKAFTILGKQLRNYVQVRAEGHTRAFLLAALTNRVQPSTIADPDLRVLASDRPLLPVSWLRKEVSGTTTNRAGRLVSQTISTTVVNGRSVTNENLRIPQADEVCRWARYVLVDGEVAWRYFVMFNADGSLDYVYDHKCDAKELDPKYQKAFKEVKAEVEAEMKKNGSYREFGSVQLLWLGMKEKLAGRGIQWRSPMELNPDSCYD